MLKHPLVSSAVLAAVLLAPLARSQVTVRVPGDRPTIAAALLAAGAGDTVLVSPGTYRESLLLQDRDVVLRSEAGPGVTVIRGDGTQPVILVQGTAVTRATRIEGFTITGGRGSLEGGGIMVQSGAAPVIARNVIEGNTAGSGGCGIGVGFASPRIEQNVIRRNLQSGGAGGIGGGGVVVRGASRAELVGNVIAENQHGSAGGGVTLFAAGDAVLRDNLIRGNTAQRGGGVSVVNPSREVLAQNLIVDNRASVGAGVELGGTPVRLLLIGNTVANNVGQSAVDVFSFGAGFESYDNIFAGDHSGALVSSFRAPSSPATFRHNLWFNASGPLFDAAGPTGVIGSDGNIAADPGFVDPGYGDYHLRSDSPARDAGTQQVPFGLPATDFWGRPRIAGGPVFGQVDIGADEDDGVRPYGRGCALTSGWAPNLVAVGGEPRLGNGGFAFELREARPQASCALLIGISRTQWGNLALPWEMGLIGLPGCVLWTSVQDSALRTTDTAGVARYGYPLPVDVVFRGARIFAQWLVAGPGPAFLPGDVSGAVMVELR